MKKRYQKPPKLEYRRFRVRGHIRSFRDLEIYKQTTLLSSRIYNLEFPPKIKGKKLQAQRKVLVDIRRKIYAHFVEIGCSAAGVFHHVLHVFTRFKVALAYESVDIYLADVVYLKGPCAGHGQEKGHYGCKCHKTMFFH